MSTADAAWLRMDRPTNLMIVNSVLWFDEPVDWERCKAVFLDRIVARFDRFRQRAADGLPLAPPHWEDDPNFDEVSTNVRISPATTRARCGRSI